MLRPASRRAFHSSGVRVAQRVCLSEASPQHGHSTPQVAGAFARGVGAKNLVLTHFSSRYCPTHRPVMNEILSFAQKAFKGRVTAAADLMQIFVNVDGTVRVVEAPPSRARRYIQSFEELRAEREQEEREAGEEHATV